MLNSSSSEFELRLALLPGGFDDFEHRADILLDGEAAEDRGFLRQITDAEPRALIHRQFRDVVAVELDRAAIRLDQAGDHVEHGGLAGAVRAQQADGFATAHIDADAAHDLARAETFFHAMHSQEARPPQQLRRRRAVAFAGRAGLAGFARGRGCCGCSRWSSLRVPDARWRLAMGLAVFPRQFRDRRRMRQVDARHGASRAIGGASRTGLVSMLPKESPSAVMSSRERAKPALPRFAGRRRNMPSKSTIPALLTPFRGVPQPAPRGLDSPITA